MILSSAALIPTSAIYGEIECTRMSNLPALGAPGAVTVLLARPEALDATRREAFDRVLSAGERQRWRGFVCPDTALQFLVGRGILRAGLSAYADVAPDRWRFAFGAHGKPRVAAPRIDRPLRFNLSHTRGLVALAICQGFDVGIDVEDSSRPLDVFELAPLALSPNEWSAIEPLAPTERTQRFYQLWTLKEAYVKALGAGLSLALPEVAFEPHGGTFRLAPALEGSAPWDVWTMRPTDRHALAVAAQVPNLSVTVVRLR